MIPFDNIKLHLLVCAYIINDINGSTIHASDVRKMLPYIKLMFFFSQGQCVLAVCDENRTRQGTE